MQQFFLMNFEASRVGLRNISRRCFRKLQRLHCQGHMQLQRLQVSQATPLDMLNDGLASWRGQLALQKARRKHALLTFQKGDRQGFPCDICPSETWRDHTQQV